MTTPIENHLDEMASLSTKLKTAFEIERAIPDAFEFGKVSIQWSRRRHNENPRSFVWRGVLTRGDGSTREIPLELLPLTLTEDRAAG
jgi:hypothetical protein